MNSYWTEKRSIVAIAASILALTEILDATIVGVSLPNIMGSLGANTTQASWILTSYIIAAAIFMPMSGLFTKKFGRKRVLLSSTVLFGMSSILCGLSTSLTQMVIFRTMQGVGGAFIPTLAQAYIVDNYEDSERPKIMTFYSLSCIMGPILGPVLGGFITQHMDWRWVFYVNVPICIIGFSVLFKNMCETGKSKIKIDYYSFLFLLLGVGLIEYFLNQGNNVGWFQSNTIIVSLVFGIIFFSFFIWRGMSGKSVIDFTIFKDRNFIKYCIILILFYAMITCVMSFFPTMLETIYNFPTETVGFIVSPRGIAALIAAPLTIKLSRKIKPDILIMIGITLFIISSIFLTLFSPYQGEFRVLIPVILQGAGMAMVLSLLALEAYKYIPKHLADSATGAYSFVRNIGNSIGVAVSATIISTESQVNWHSMIQHITPFSRGYKLWLQNTAFLSSSNIGVIANKISFNASFISFLDTYYFSIIIGVSIIAGMLLLKAILKFKSKEIRSKI